MIVLLDHVGRPIETHGEHDKRTADLKVSIAELCAGKPAGDIAIACIEYVIHVAQQSNGNRAFREGIATAFDEGARVMRQHL